jgi:hypothetical protein
MSVHTAEYTWVVVNEPSTNNYVSPLSIDYADYVDLELREKR